MTKITCRIGLRSVQGNALNGRGSLGSQLLIVLVEVNVRVVVVEEVLALCLTGGRNGEKRRS